MNKNDNLLIGIESRTPKVRDERIDSVKYWLILLVIAGHVFKQPEFSHSRECVVAWQWIYFFHMPLFIFISGYFSKKKDKNAFWPSIWKLLEPLIVFQAIVIIPNFIMEGSDDYLNDILTPWQEFWYLLSLIYWRSLLQIIPDKILGKTRLMLFITICISIIAGFLPFDRFLSLQRTLSFMPFFYLGYCMKGKNIYLPNKFKPLSFLFLILMVIYPIFFPQYVGSLVHAQPYATIFGIISRIIVLFGIAIPMSIAFINICPNTHWSAQQGKLTLQYYIYHALVLILIMFVLVKLNVPTTFISATIITLVIIVGIGFASYLPFFKKLTNPLSLMKK